MDLEQDPGEGSPVASPDWTGSIRTEWEAAVGAPARRVWLLRLGPEDDLAEPLASRHLSEVGVQHPAGFVDLWTPPSPIHAAEYELSAGPTQATIRLSGPGRLPRELYLQPAAPASLDGLVLSAVIGGEPYEATWAPEPGLARRVKGGEAVLVVGPAGQELSLIPAWVPAPSQAPPADPTPLPSPMSPP